MKKASIGERLRTIVVTVEGLQSFARAWEALGRPIRRFARTVTSDRDEREDLIEEGMVRLCELDPTRYDLARAADRAYLMECVINHMWDKWGTRERLQAKLDEIAPSLGIELRALQRAESAESDAA